MGLPWIAYIVGWAISTALRQKHEDIIAISIEAGVQNTGIAIFILRFALGQPQADLTTVIPVSVAIMTPFPLLFYYLYSKGKEWFVLRRINCIKLQSDDSFLISSISRRRRGVMAIPTSPPIPLTDMSNNKTAPTNAKN